MPVGGCASDYSTVPEEMYGDAVTGVGLKFVPMPSARVQECTVLYACHAAGPEQRPTWGHTVMPGMV